MEAGGVTATVASGFNFNEEQDSQGDVSRLYQLDKAG